MSDQIEIARLRQKLAAQTEEVLGRLTQDLLENRLVNSAIAKAFEARTKAIQAQEVAMGALNIPSAADIERLTRRLRSVSTRLESIEESVERLDRAVGALAAERALGGRLGAIEEQLGAMTRLLEQRSSAPADGDAPVAHDGVEPGTEGDPDAHSDAG